jgi:hypothetical protein
MNRTDEQELVRSSARRLRETILRQLGLGTPLLLSLACNSNSTSDGDEGGVTTNPSSGADDLDGDASADTDPGDESGNDEDDEPPLKLDVNVKYDLPPLPPMLCWSDWYFEPGQFPPEFAGCSLGPFDPGLTPDYQMVCVAPPDDGSCEDICSDSLCEGMESCVSGTIFDSCGPIVVDGDCCTMIATETPPPVGRPFVIAGQQRLAAAPEQLGLLAAHWLEVARGEHASIAAFARFIATLLRFAAPAQLLADAIAAAGDEARHTRDALALASRFADRSLALGELEIEDALLHSDDLARAVHDAVLEGCVAETLAAHEAACLAAHAEDPQVAAMLRRVADDEARHAGLAWRFVAWVLDTQPELRDVVERAFMIGLAPRSVTKQEQTCELLGLGCPSAGLRARWREVGLRELVSPCATQMFEQLATRTARARTTWSASARAPAPPR